MTELARRPPPGKERGTKAEVRARQERVVDHAIDGKDWVWIAAEEGFAGHQGARAAYKAGIKRRVSAEDRDDAWRLEVALLTDLIDNARRRLRAEPDEHWEGTKVIADLSTKRARLMGAEAPRRVEVDVTGTVEVTSTAEADVHAAAIYHQQMIHPGQLCDICRDVLTPPDTP